MKRLFIVLTPLCAHGQAGVCVGDLLRVDSNAMSNARETGLAGGCASAFFTALLRYLM